MEDHEERNVSFKDLLKEKAGSGKLVSVFCNPDDSAGAVVGYVACCDDDYFCVLEVTPEGTYDGYFLRKTDQVFRVDADTYYERSLHKLYTHYGERHLPFAPSGNILADLLQFAQDQKFVVGVGVRDYGQTSCYGLVDSVDTERELMTLRQLNTDEGFDDGFVIISFDSVYRMCCDEEKCVTLRTLNMLSKGEQHG